jgi:uncharacterized membrane protein
MDRGRLEAFSDGVFAVAITLLALDLVVAGPDPRHAHLLHQLREHWPAFAAYVISFFTIGIIWVNHHVLVRSITVVNRPLLFLNLLLLLFVVLIPFGTATAAEYLNVGNSDAKVAMALYSAVFIGMSAGFGSIFEWTLHGERVYEPVPADKRWAARIRFVGGGAVYVVAFIVALFSPIASFVLIALTAMYYMLQRTPGAVGTDDAVPPEDAPPS